MSGAAGKRSAKEKEDKDKELEDATRLKNLEEEVSRLEAENATLEAAGPPTQPDMAAMLKALTAAITAGFASVPSTPTTTVVKKHSTSLDPYGAQGLDTDTKDGKYQWVLITKMMTGWKLLPISVENADRLMDLFKDRKVQFGLDLICTVPTSGTGNAYPSPRTIAGAEYQNTDLKEHFELLKDIHILTLSHVRAFSGWFMGGEKSTLTASTDMQIKAIDPNKVGNDGLVNQ